MASYLHVIKEYWKKVRRTSGNPASEQDSLPQERPAYLRYIES